MKILRLRFKNLNSLVGEWEIDLTDPTIASEGIFVITGPTGAGKSTILDAICLALYGRTPRLSRINKSGNEIMSRQTGECFAEVSFETQSGRYRCHWSQRRARKNPRGELQAPKHEIVKADSGQIVESSLRGVADEIASVAGMDFERFTRSMLLAQGGFAAFLQASPDDRAPILEQMTGTEIYSLISIHVHKRQRAERDKLNHLQVEIAGIEILEPGREEEIVRALDAKRKEEATLAVRTTALENAIRWLGGIDILKKEIVRLDEEAGRLRNDCDAFAPDREKLGRALRAASLDGEYEALAALRKEQTEDLKAAKADEEALPGLESSALKEAESVKSAERWSVDVKEALKTAVPELRKLRALDQKLADQKKILAEDEASCARDAAKIDALQKTRREENEKHFKANGALEKVDAYLKENARDEWLLGGLAGVEARLTHLASSQKKILQKENDRKKAAKAFQEKAKAFDDFQKEIRARKQEADIASKKLHQGKDALNQALKEGSLREYRAEKDALLREMSLLARIKDLEALREKLEDGKPCPLCGAVKHPYAEGNIPVPDEIEKKIDALTRRIADAEAKEEAVEKRAEAQTQANENLAEAEKRAAEAAHARKAAEKDLADLVDVLEKSRADFSEEKKVVLGKLLPLGIVEIPEAGISSLLDALEARRAAWQAQTAKKAEAEKRIAAIESERKRLDALIASQSAVLVEKRNRFDALEKEVAARSEARKEQYGSLAPDDEESRLNKAVSDAESAEKKARERNDQIRQRLDAARIRVESLKKSIERRRPKLFGLETRFAAALAPAGFSDEARFLGARLDPAERDALAAKAKALDERQTSLKARRKDREARLVDEMARKLSDESLETLETRFRESRESLKSLQENIAELKHALGENEAAKARMKTKRTAIDAQKKECRRWESLNELIGSHDGKKYRNFVQGLTFERVIAHANRQLQKLTDRYLLVHDDREPLELDVVDNYQAGEIRTTKNLSGGESFIVSLALALGLSQMASKNVRVDSLFLDEGFGTLDEESLDTALETLAGLRHDGKQIGVISHVPALKERIAAQIVVTPQSGGKGRLSGAGIRGFGGSESGCPASRA